MMLLTTADVCTVADITSAQLAAWCKQGLIDPVEGGERQGKHRLFNVVQAVALAHANKWRSCGASLSSMAAIIRFITGYTEEGLQREFAAGCRVAFYLGIKPSEDGSGYETEPILLPMLDGSIPPKQVDLQDTYEEVTERINDIKSKRAVNKRRVAN
jgi:hypothetical protein